MNKLIIFGIIVLLIAGIAIYAWLYGTSSTTTTSGGGTLTVSTSSSTPKSVSDIEDVTEGLYFPPTIDRAYPYHFKLTTNRSSKIITLQAMDGAKPLSGANGITFELQKLPYVMNEREQVKWVKEDSFGMKIGAYDVVFTHNNDVFETPEGVYVSELRSDQTITVTINEDDSNALDIKSYVSGNKTTRTIYKGDVPLFFDIIDSGNVKVYLKYFTSSSIVQEYFRTKDDGSITKTTVTFNYDDS